MCFARWQSFGLGSYVGGLVYTSKVRIAQPTQSSGGAKVKEAPNACRATSMLDSTARTIAYIGGREASESVFR